LKIEIDPTYRDIIDHMRKKSKHFADIYNDLDKRPSLFTLKCRPGQKPKTGRSPAEGSPGFFPPAYNIGIDSNVTDYRYVGLDGKSYPMTIEQVIAHEISHPYMRSGTETGANGVIASENAIMAELNPNGMRRSTTDDRLFKPDIFRECECSK
jgi:hypothetical protein